MFPFSNYNDIIALPLFACHNKLSSPFTFSYLYFFSSSFLSFALLFSFFSPIVDPPISSTIFILPFLIFLFFTPSPTDIREHQNKLIRDETLLQSKLVKKKTKTSYLKCNGAEESAKGLSSNVLLSEAL